MTTLALAGRIIAVTRPREQAGALAAGIEKAGGRALLFPLLEIAPPSDPTVLRSAAGLLDGAAMAIFISPNAVRFGVPPLLEHAAWPSTLALAAVGQGTAGALEAALQRPVLFPDEPYDSEALLELPALAADRVTGRTVLIFKGEGGREALAETLSARGARVVSVACYRRLPPGGNASDLLRTAQSGQLDAIVVTSSEAMKHLADLFDRLANRTRPQSLIVVPHPRIAESARRLGFDHVLEATSGDAAVLAALTAYNWPSHRPLKSMNEQADPHAPPAADNSAAVRDVDKELEKAPAENSRLRRIGSRRVWIGVLLALILALVWQVVDLRQRISNTQAELARRLAEDDVQRSDLKAQGRQTLELIQNVQQKLTVFETRVGDVQTRQESIDGVFQDLARGRDEWLLAEIEHMLTLAAQQLQIIGDVAAAASVLEHASTRLAHSQRPQFIALRKAIGVDLQRLRGVQSADMAGISLAIETIALNVDALGLAFESRPPAATARAGGAAKAAVSDKTAEVKPPEAFWQRWLRETWTEVRGLIHVERMDRADAGLLVPNQVLFLRENLKLRLLAARVELRSRDQVAFRSEVRQALHWLDKYFDPRDPRVQSASEALKALLANDLIIAAPALTGSLAAVRLVKFPAQQGAR